MPRDPYGLLFTQDGVPADLVRVGAPRRRERRAEQQAVLVQRSGRVTAGRRPALLRRWRHILTP